MRDEREVYVGRMEEDGGMEDNNGAGRERTNRGGKGRGRRERSKKGRGRRTDRRGRSSRSGANHVRARTHSPTDAELREASRRERKEKAKKEKDDGRRGVWIRTVGGEHQLVKKKKVSGWRRAGLLCCV